MYDDDEEEENPLVASYSDLDVKKTNEQMDTKWVAYKSNYIEKVKVASMSPVRT